jgi:peptidoglycan/xylan/chitin deacetylase (PgdA/CDA1 family)
MLSPLATGLAAAAALGLAAGGFAYASRWPGSRLFGGTLIAPRRPGELALTFDDGPNPTWTPRLLDLLATHGVKATFFVLGKNAGLQPELVRRIVAHGHLLGNHSWGHLDLALAAANLVREEMLRSQQALQAISAKPVKFFRPPFGARRPVVLRTARELGMTPVLWNAMTSDWREPSARKIAARLQRKIDRLEYSGHAANIVLHDGSHKSMEANRAPSVAAVEALILHYGNTHKFVTLDAWT